MWKAIEFVMTRKIYVEENGIIGYYVLIARLNSVKKGHAMLHSSQLVA